MTSQYAGIDNLIDNTLVVTKNDQVLVCNDPGHQNLANEVINQLKTRGLNFETISIDYDGSKIPEQLADKLLSNDNNVIFLFFKNSIWHQPERRKAKYELKKRLVYYSGNLDMLKDGPALADPQGLKQICQDLEPHIANGTKIILEGPNNTKISGECEKIGFETGLYSQPAQGGNFPSGEIYSFGLKDETIEGFVHSNLKVKNLGLSAPGNDAIFTVKQGKLSPVEDLPAPNFFNLIKDYEELWHVGELAFGICPYTKIFANPDSAQEEKILGTAHVGLGGNISFGGQRKGKHMDLMFGPTTVSIDNKKIIIDGKINTEYLSAKSIEWLKSINPEFLA